MSDPTFDIFTKQVDGHIRFTDPRLKMWGDKRLHIKVTRAKNKRSNPQNAYLWGVIYPCALKGFHDMGYMDWTVNDAHNFFKDQFSTEYVELINPNTGEAIQARKTTTTMTKFQMMTYQEQIKMFCAEWFQIIIPDPTPLFCDEYNS